MAPHPGCTALTLTIQTTDPADIAIVGAGAAGLMAAIFARRASSGLRVVALDGAKRIGAKILIAGGGRCNVTHDVVTAADFNGSRNAIAKVLRTFDVEATVRFFAELGVTLKVEEGGKLFPTTDRARTVLEALVGAVEQAGAEIIDDCRVTAISRNETGFLLETSRGVMHAKKVILATGGRSVPKTGSDGSGYLLARALGHTVTDVFPALVPLVLASGHWLTELSGTSMLAELVVRAASGKVLHRDRGSLLFTHFGLSGPLALDVSRHLLAARRDDPGVELVVSFLPGQTFESLETSLRAEAERNARATAASFLRGRMPERVLDRLAPSTMLRQQSRDDRRRMIRELLEQALPVVRDRGFDYAEVTAGGVPLNEIDTATMQSRIAPGMYLCGELLDVDGRIGGYNFQWAWSTGRMAGMAAAKVED